MDSTHGHSESPPHSISTSHPFEDVNPHEGDHLDFHGLDDGEFNCLYGHLINGLDDQVGRLNLNEDTSTASSPSGSPVDIDIGGSGSGSGVSVSRLINSAYSSPLSSSSASYSSFSDGDGGRISDRNYFVDTTRTRTSEGSESNLVNFLWSIKRKRRRLTMGNDANIDLNLGVRVSDSVINDTPNTNPSSLVTAHLQSNGQGGHIFPSPSASASASVPSSSSSWVLNDYDDSAHKGNHCNRTWDGLLCWPETPAGTQISLPCFKQFRGISYDERGTVTRLCQVGGVWQNKTTDYSQCIPKPHPSLNEGLNSLGTHDVYFAGYCLSLLALLIAMFIFITFKELRCLRNKIHTHLIITYILADSLWLLTSIQSHVGHQAQVSCVSFILLHYFHLTNFFWMFVEGLYLYILVVQTFIAEHVKFRIYASIGWGLPFLVVLCWSIAKWLAHTPILPKLMDSDQEISNCFWLTMSVYDWIYKSPAILVLAANTLFLVQIMWVLITKLRSATNLETQQSRKAAKALLVLMPLFGITYVLVLRGSSQTPAYEFTRALLISTQGFLVALFYCFFNGEVRIAIRHRWNRLDLGCCETRGHAMQMRDWAPIRLYTPTQLTPNHQRKRESSASETTSMGMTGGNLNSNSNPNPNSAININAIPNASVTNGQLIVTTSRKLSPITTKTYNPNENNSLL